MRKLEPAALRKLRLTISESGKEAYARETLLRLPDQIAIVKK